MIRKYPTLPWRLLTGFVLLASMLFYASGAALVAHIKLEHANDACGVVRVACVDAHDTPCRSDNPSPGDVPASPTSKRCQLCDMLASATRAAVTADAGPSLVTRVEVFSTPIPDRLPVVHLFVCDISRRGPPLSA